MNDEGVGIAGWLLADLMLVLALVFLALTSGVLSADRDPEATPVAAEPSVEAPLVEAPEILDLGCEQGERVAGLIPVHCEPRLRADEAQSYAWTAERGEPDAGDASSFLANFKDAGAVRLTVSNEGGDDSAEFAVLPPPAAPPIIPPVILNIGCEMEAPGGPAAGGRINVRCTPEIGGDEPFLYKWTAERGEPDAGGASSFLASFYESGAVTLTVSSDGSEHSAAFPVLLPRTAVVASAPECSEVQTDFRFAQIVLTGAALGAVDWDEIANSQVREDVIKSAELDKIGDGDWSDSRAEAFLREKLAEGLRIALVETFAHEPDGNHVDLARHVNDAFSEGLRRAGIDILRDAPAEGRWEWFGDYLAPKALVSQEVRLNLYFVKPFDDEDCR